MSETHTLARKRGDKSGTMERKEWTPHLRKAVSKEGKMGKQREPPQEK